MPDPRNLDAGWSIGEMAFKRITTLPLQMPIAERILEFGLFNPIRNIYGVTPEHIQEFTSRTKFYTPKRNSKL